MIGSRIRERRKEVGLSLRDLGEMTGLTASFLSQVENDQTSPSISSLQKIATALQIAMFNFLDDAPQNEVVVRANSRRKMSFPESKLEYELITNDLGRKMVCFILRLEAGARHQAQRLYQPTEEIVFVLEGKLEIQVGENIYTLMPGDSLHYDGMQLKWISSVGNTELKAFYAITPPVL